MRNVAVWRAPAGWRAAVGRAALAAALVAAGAMSAALDAMLEASMWTQSTTEQIELGAQQVLVAKLDAVMLATVRDFDARGTARELGASSTQEWLRDRFLLRPSEAKRRVKVADALDRRYPPIATAQRVGWLSPAHVHVLVKALDGFPSWVSTEQVAWAQDQLLDVGRRFRHVGEGIWKALLIRDIGCVFPGCTRPASYCDAHHLRHWCDGGETCLDNCAQLCGHHHHVVHHNGWDIRLGDDRKPELLPPAWVDPERRPRRNTYWDTPQFTRA